jgi:hypothetical protein
MANMMPSDSVMFFAEGLTRRHDNIPARTQRFLDAVADLVKPETTAQWNREPMPMPLPLNDLQVLS